MPRSRNPIRSISLIPVVVTLLIVTLADSRSMAGGDLPLTHTDLVELLRSGGYSLYFRHEATDWSQSDQIHEAGDWKSCDDSRVRQLSSEGRQRAIATGEAIRALKIPIGKVLASPYCRTMETARLFNLGSVEPNTDVINMRIAEYFGGTAAIIENAKALLASAPDSGTNTLVVAHGNVARNATLVYPEEGEGVIFEADGNGGFDFIGRMTAEDWKRIGWQVQ